MRAHKAAILSALSPRQIFASAQLGTLNKLCNVFHSRRPPLFLSPCGILHGLVLCVFTLAPFEPLDSASLEAVTYKTFVLTALALGARRGELFALSQGQFVHPAEDWSFFVIF